MLESVSLLVPIRCSGIRGSSVCYGCRAGRRPIPARLRLRQHTSGDSYCVDTNVTNERGEYPIVLFGHEAIDENTELSYIQDSRVEAAFSLDDFLVQFAARTLSQDVRFPRKSWPS